VKFRDWEVPEVLVSGHHENIDKWRNKQSLFRTLERRPDLLEGREFTKQEKKWLEEWHADNNSKQE
jgi:tRNA (guanine37-N1)-methyltransferase